MKAFINCDPLELPEVVNDLLSRLETEKVDPIFTAQPCQELLANQTQPFFYYRTPYLRFDAEGAIVSFLEKNPKTTHIATRDGEIIAHNPEAPKDYSFTVNAECYYYQPNLPPLPILLGTSRRPIYFELTLNSLIYNCKDPRQKIYIVVSNPDSQTLAIAQKFLANPQIEVVEVSSDLKYAFANFGSKFFNLSKFIHFEDDGILPENTHHLLPYWGSQLHHRSSTADLTSLCVVDYTTTKFIKSAMNYQTKGFVLRSKGQPWFYPEKSTDHMLPIGGFGLVINAETFYRDFRGPNFFKTDNNLFLDAKTVCLGNVSVYHIGNNQMMDYPDYVKNKKDLTTSQYHYGKDLRTGRIKLIDLEKDWKRPFEMSV